MNDFIVKTLRFDASAVSSFFTVDDDGNRQKEIVAFDAEGMGDDILSMDDTPIRKVINASCMNLEYVYDMLSESCLEIEYAGGYPGEEETPVCLEIRGTLPRQKSLRKVFSHDDDLDLDDKGSRSGSHYGTDTSKDFTDDDSWLDDSAAYGDDAFSDDFTEGGGSGRFESLDDYIDKM